MIRNHDLLVRITHTTRSMELVPSQILDTYTVYSNEKQINWMGAL